MSTNAPIPTELTLHREARLLELAYADGRRFQLPCEYLRVYSPSVEVRGLGELVTGKERVNITEIAPMGNYAVRIFFDDRHRSGVYSWEYLYELAINRPQYWNDYLRRLQQAGYHRGDAAAEAG